MPGVPGGRSVNNTGPRLILCADFDAFYAQVELMRHPELSGRPIGAQQWQMLLAVSYGARPYGVRRGTTATEARRLCPTIACVPVEMRNGKPSLEPYRAASAVAMRAMALAASAIGAVQPPIPVALPPSFMVGLGSGSEQQVSAATATFEKGSVDECFVDLQPGIDRAIHLWKAVAAKVAPHVANTLTDTRHALASVTPSPAPSSRSQAALEAACVEWLLTEGAVGVCTAAAIPLEEASEVARPAEGDAAMQPATRRGTGSSSPSHPSDSVAVKPGDEAVEMAIGEGDRLGGAGAESGSVEAVGGAAAEGAAAGEGALLEDRHTAGGKGAVKEREVYAMEGGRDGAEAPVAAPCDVTADARDVPHSTAIASPSERAAVAVTASAVVREGFPLPATDAALAEASPAITTREALLAAVSRPTHSSTPYSASSPTKGDVKREVKGQHATLLPEIAERRFAHAVQTCVAVCPCALVVHVARVLKLWDEVGDPVEVHACTRSDVRGVGGEGVAPTPSATRWQALAARLRACPCDPFEWVAAACPAVPPLPRSMTHPGETAAAALAKSEAKGKGVGAAKAEGVGGADGGVGASADAECGLDVEAGGGEGRTCERGDGGGRGNVALTGRTLVRGLVGGSASDSAFDGAAPPPPKRRFAQQVLAAAAAAGKGVEVGSALPVPNSFDGCGQVGRTGMTAGHCDGGAEAASRGRLRFIRRGGGETSLTNVGHGPGGKDRAGPPMGSAPVVHGNVRGGGTGGAQRGDGEEDGSESDDEGRSSGTSSRSDEDDTHFPDQGGLSRDGTAGGEDPPSPPSSADVVVGSRPGTPDFVQPRPRSCVCGCLRATEGGGSDGGCSDTKASRSFLSMLVGVDAEPDVGVVKSEATPLPSVQAGSVGASGSCGGDATGGLSCGVVRPDVVAVKSGYRVTSAAPSTLAALPLAMQLGGVAAALISGIVRLRLGYSLTCAVAGSRLAAKVANATNKPAKVTIVPAPSVAKLLAPRTLDGVTGLGGKLGLSIARQMLNAAESLAAARATSTHGVGVGAGTLSVPASAVAAAAGWLEGLDVEVMRTKRMSWRLARIVNAGAVTRWAHVAAHSAQVRGPVSLDVVEWLKGYLVGTMSPPITAREEVKSHSECKAIVPAASLSSDADKLLSWLRSMADNLAARVVRDYQVKGSWYASPTIHFAVSKTTAYSRVLPKSGIAPRGSTRGVVAAALREGAWASLCDKAASVASGATSVTICHISMHLVVAPPVNVAAGAGGKRRGTASTPMLLANPWDGGSGAVADRGGVLDAFLRPGHRKVVVGAAERRTPPLVKTEAGAAPACSAASSDSEVCLSSLSSESSSASKGRAGVAEGGVEKDAEAPRREDGGASAAALVQQARVMQPGKAGTAGETATGPHRAAKFSILDQLHSKGGGVPAVKARLSEAGGVDDDEQATSLCSVLSSSVAQRVSGGVAPAEDLVSSVVGVGRSHSHSELADGRPAGGLRESVVDSMLRVFGSPSAAPRDEGPVRHAVDPRTPATAGASASIVEESTSVEAVPVPRPSKRVNTLVRCLRRSPVPKDMADTDSLVAIASEASDSSRRRVAPPEPSGAGSKNGSVGGRHMPNGLEEVGVTERYNADSVSDDEVVSIVSTV